MQVTVEYNEVTGEIRDKNGLSVFMLGLVSLDPIQEKAPVLELIKQGVTPDEMIKLRNNNLL